MSKLLFQYNVRNCRIFENLSYPNTSPVIDSLSIYNSQQGLYTTVYISGSNFSLGGTTGYSTVTFGLYTNIPVIFYNSLYISFQVPIYAVPATYSVTVVNNSQNPLYSNSVNYTIDISSRISKYIE